MGKTTNEWTDASWNPIVGCTECSPGCANCYAARLAATRLRTTPQYIGLAELLGTANPSKLTATWHPRWTGEVRFLPERLEEPLHWKKPLRIFVCDMGDLFHEDVHGDWIDQVLAIIARCPQHTFQILTKRPSRMRDFMWKYYTSKVAGFPTTLENVWLGVSVENQHFADERIPVLLATPAAVRWISAEPLLGPVDLHFLAAKSFDPPKHGIQGWGNPPHWMDGWPMNPIDWVVCGGESGPGARPMHPDWARSLRDQCQAAAVPFFFKQWGNWSFDQKFYQKLPDSRVRYFEPNVIHPDGKRDCLMYRVGKKKAGRQLDGREWNEFPATPQQ